MSNAKQPEALRLADGATKQLDHIDRYLDKNWLDGDLPDGKIYEALTELRRLHAENEQFKTAVGTVCEGWTLSYDA